MDPFSLRRPGDADVMPLGSCNMNTRLGRRLANLLVLLLALDSSAFSQNGHWREIKGKPLLRFDWNCASPSVYPKLKLARHVAVALKNEDAAEGIPDRAFAFDLNRDRRPEYFVPLVCGAVGNCTWGVYALAPVRFLGTVNGEFIYVHKRPGRWPGIITYGHLSAAEGVLDTYVFRKGRYCRTGKEYPVGPEDRTLEIQNVPGRKMPSFLTKARGGCKSLGL